MNVKNIFDQASKDLTKMNNYLAVEVIKLGYPQASVSVPTAGVAWDKERKKIIFLMNLDFMSTLNPEQACFVLAHEAIHVLNGHIFLLRESIDDMEKKHLTKKEILKFRKKMNIAMDCVVNDSLINLYKVPKAFEEEPIKAWYGKSAIGRDCDNLTAWEVFYLLKDEAESEDADDHDSWDSFFAKSGDVDSEFVESFKKILENNLENSRLSDEEHEALDKAKKAFDDFNNPNGKAGDGVVSNKKAVDKFGKESLNWNKLLFQFVDTLKPEDVWNRPNKKLLYSYPDIILPTSKDKEKEKIFLAIDISGSIDHKALNLFLTLVKNTPKRFEINAITFNTSCYKFDVNKDEVYSGGGTNFQIIEDYILNNFKKYPKAIFILTDGEGTRVTARHPERWCWLLYGSCSTMFCDKMKNYKIYDIMKK